MQERTKCFVVLYIAAVIAGLITLLLISRVVVEVTYSQLNKELDFLLMIRGPLGLSYKRETFPHIGLEHELHSWRIGIQPDPHTVYGDNVLVFWPAAKYVMRHVTVRHLSWQTSVGTGESAATALVVGALWSIKGSLFALFQSYVTMKGDNLVLAVYPDFRQTCFQTSLQCIVSFRIVHLIIAAIFVLREKIRRRKGVVVSGKSSHSGTDENSHGKYSGHGGC